MVEMLNMDCMEFLKNTPDKAFELAIVDPPYNVGASDGKFGRGGKGDKKHAPSIPRNLKHYANANSVPIDLYFEQLFRISKNQIVWGANYYPKHFTHSGWIVWDKQNTGPLSDGELAFQSLNKLVRIYKLQWSGFIKNDGIHSKDIIHPNQKPVALYKWLLQNYAKPGDKILDTHGGSGSICIACHDLGFDLTWMELDADYYKAACERYQRHAAQGSLFDPQEVRSKPVEHELF